MDGHDSTNGIDQRLQKLKEDNDILRSMLRRAMGDAVSKQQTNANKDIARKAASVEKVQEELRAERDRRVRAEVLLSERKAQWDTQKAALEAKIVVEANRVKNANIEFEKIRVRLRDAEFVVETLKKENARLVEESRCGTTPSRSGSASHHGPAASNLTIQQADRLRRDVPSLRSHAGRLPPNVMRRVFQSTPRSSAARREVSPGPSVSTPSRAWVTIGTRVTWRGLQGIVQYLGRVDGLGDTITWAGLELLLQGAGDHDGEFDGVRYFETAPRSAVFASLGELLPPKEPPVSPVQPRASSSSRSNVSPPRHSDDGVDQQSAIALDASFVRSETPVRRLQSGPTSEEQELMDCQREEEGSDGGEEGEDQLAATVEPQPDNHDPTRHVVDGPTTTAAILAEEGEKQPQPETAIPQTGVETIMEDGDAIVADDHVAIDFSQDEGHEHQVEKHENADDVSPAEQSIIDDDPEQTENKLHEMEEPLAAEIPVAIATGDDVASNQPSHHHDEEAVEEGAAVPITQQHDTANVEPHQHHSREEGEEVTNDGIPNEQSVPPRDLDEY